MACSFSEDTGYHERTFVFSGRSAPKQDYRARLSFQVLDQSYENTFRVECHSIVCTRSDDIQASEAKNDWKGQRAKRIQQPSAEVATARGQIDDIKRLLDEYDDEDLTKEEDDEVYDLHRDLRKEDLKTFLVETRNAEVTKKPQASYRDKVRGGIVYVFCISNTEYWSKATLPKDEAIPYLQLSGIIALRKHCLSIIADRQLRLTTKFVTNDIPALLGEAGLWVESGAGSANAEQKSAVRRTLDKIER
ncbi:hypothetical protein COL922a_013543 [Colletotrichum nupharicola]|nr:hypothetical protein COL922a_013543 [Colletotrichum nupharicola]